MEHDPRLIILILLPVGCCLALLGYLSLCQKQLDKEIDQVRDETLKDKQGKVIAKFNDIK